MTGVIGPVLAGLGLGVALAGAPGPVQAVILAESVRGGAGRGLRAQAGANLTMAAILVALALGLSVLAPAGTPLRLLKIAGGLFLLWLAVDGVRAPATVGSATETRRSLPPTVRGVLAVLLNPGAWLFLATAASSLLSTAGHEGGTVVALAAALALALGVAAGDGVVVLLGSTGVRRTGDRVQVWVGRGLALILGTLGVWLLVSAATA